MFTGLAETPMAEAISAGKGAPALIAGLPLARLKSHPASFTKNGFVAVFSTTMLGGTASLPPIAVTNCAWFV